MDIGVTSQLLLVLLITAFGSAGQAAIGMGLNLFAIPLLTLLDPSYAPGPVLVASLFLSCMALWRVPAEINVQELLFSLIGLVFGTCAAGIILALVNIEFFEPLLGLLIILAVGLVLSGWSAKLTNSNLAIAGAASGVMGTIAGVHAPPIALLYQGLAPDRVRGAVLTFVGLGNALSIFALWLVGKFGAAQLQATLVLLPGVLLGLMFAPFLARMLDARSIRLLILSISALSGIALIFK